MGKGVGVGFISSWTRLMYRNYAIMFNLISYPGFLLTFATYILLAASNDN